jgi:NAD(P)-dependent dehydrogenase (short-subunit alcohol dehydrogenase family)
MTFHRGRRAVIIGGGSGIGLATAARLARAGADVIIVGRSVRKLKAAAATIPGQLGYYVADSHDDASMRQLFDQVGPYHDLIVTAADPPAAGPFLDLPIERVHKFFESKFWGSYRAVRYGVPLIQTDGSITLTSGTASQRPSPGHAGTSAVNAAVEALARTLALELAPIRVNVVSPGIIATPVWEAIMDKRQRDALFDWYSNKLPLGRIGTADEVAGAILHVIENTYMTGAVLVVDGGYIQV